MQAQESPAEDGEGTTCVPIPRARIVLVPSSAAPAESRNSAAHSR